MSPPSPLGSHHATQQHSATTKPAAAASAGLNPRSLKSRLAAGETLYGIFLLSNCPTLSEIVGLSGYDYVVVDMEHGPGGVTDALASLRALAATRTPVIIRLPELSAAWAKKALDIGPQGVMFPMVESAREAELAVSYCHFPPRGTRSSAHTVVRASAYGFDEGYLKWLDEELLVCCQVESAAGVAEVEAIAAVDGVGCIQIGPRDLSASLGCLAEPGNAKVMEALRTAERGTLTASVKGGGGGGPYLAGMVTALDTPEELLRRGYHMVASGVDLALFRRAALLDVEEFRRAAAAAAAAGDERVRGGRHGSEARKSNSGAQILCYDQKQNQVPFVPSGHY